MAENPHRLNQLSMIDLFGVDESVPNQQLSLVDAEIRCDLPQIVRSDQISLFQLAVVRRPRESQRPPDRSSLLGVRPAM
jgi:hypothetical protein